MITIILTFIKKYWKYILAFISFPLIVAFFRKSMSDGLAIKTTKELFNDWWVVNIVGKGLVTSKTSNTLHDNAKLLSIYLGTFKGETQNTEDETRAVELILQHKFADYTCLEYAYNKYFTDSRDLTADLHSYLSSSEYSDISHVIFATNLGGLIQPNGQINNNGFSSGIVAEFENPKPFETSEGEAINYTPIWSPPPPKDIWNNTPSNY